MLEDSKKEEKLNHTVEAETKEEKETEGAARSAKRHKSSLVDEVEKVKEVIRKDDEVTDVTALSVPRGRPASGRVWKQAQKERTSSIIRNGTPTLKGGTWEKKEAEKMERIRVKELEKTLKAESAAAKQAERERIAEQNKRRAEAALRNSSYQTVCIHS